jgi:hypothetical protein
MRFRDLEPFQDCNNLEMTVILGKGFVSGEDFFFGSFS